MGRKKADDAAGVKLKGKGRRDRGEGEIEELPSGKFRATLNVGKTADGKRRRVRQTFDTYREAVAWLRERKHEQARGTLADPGKTTVGQWLDRWLELKRRDLEPTTWDGYDQHVRLHLKPVLAECPLSCLRPYFVADAYARIEEKGVSKAMQKKIATTLRAALNDAVGLQLLAVNPALAVRKPRAEARQDVKAWTADEARRFLEASRAGGDRHFPLYLLALDSGMRQGELFGLHWPEIDLEAGTVRVVRSLYQRVTELRLKDVKTKGSRRLIRLAPGTVEALQAHRRAMRKEGRNTRTGPVFVRPGGELLLKAGVYKAFLRAAEAAGVPEIRFHDLRHTSATLLLSGGINVKAVASRLGHTTPVVTLTHYAAWMPEVDEQAALVSQRALIGTMPHRRPTDEASRKVDGAASPCWHDGSGRGPSRI